MSRLADAWSTQDTEAGVQCFTEDATYMEPPDAQLFVGHDQLRTYFGALAPGTSMRWTGLWFDDETQSGAGEFVFGEAGDSIVDHGVAIVDLRDGRIRSWREYLTKGPASQEDFLALEGRSWKWHIGRYTERE
jgi:ketosteroid isomerase-like protein